MQAGGHGGDGALGFGRRRGGGSVVCEESTTAEQLGLGTCRFMATGRWFFEVSMVIGKGQSTGWLRVCVEAEKAVWEDVCLGAAIGSGKTGDG
ncbi:hypothetical protein M0R45_030387 [Rubus argutus]|uniref:Uncharacterized protein n=1 Tax=Rubus argutus TaxID=59490 RepID=A0AAW1WAV1_RUBAR